MLPFTIESNPDGVDIYWGAYRNVTFHNIGPSPKLGGVKDWSCACLLYITSQKPKPSRTKTGGKVFTGVCLLTGGGEGGRGIPQLLIHSPLLRGGGAVVSDFWSFPWGRGKGSLLFFSVHFWNAQNQDTCTALPLDTPFLIFLAVNFLTILSSQLLYCK